MKPVPGFPGYSVTERGQIWSCNGGRGRWLMPCTSKTGRPAVMLCFAGKRYLKRVCRLVLEAFVGPCPDGMEACHNNGNPADNRLENLRWDTRSSNNRDAVRHGTAPGLRHKGEDCSLSKLTASQVLAIRRKVKAGMEQRAVAKMYGVTQPCVWHIVHRKTWKHLEG